MLANSWFLTPSVLLCMVVAGFPTLGKAQTLTQERVPSAGVSPDRGQREPFVQLQSDDFVVYFAREDSLRAELVRAALEAQPPLPGLDVGLPRDVEVWLAPDERAFRRLSGGRPPEWSAAVAIPSRNRIVLPVGSPERQGGSPPLQTLRHEWAHIGLRQALPGLRVPRCFDEGYAQWAAGWNRGDVWRLRLLIALGRAPALDSLTFQWPADRASAEVAYLMAATTVEYLVQASGEGALELFLERWRDDGRFDLAMRRVYGVVPAQLETDWRAWVKKRYGWLRVASQTAIAWLLLAALLFVTVRARRRRRVERLATLRAGELPDAPEWWSEEATLGPEVEVAQDADVLS